MRLLPDRSSLPAAALLAVTLLAPAVPAEDLFACGFSAGQVLRGNPADGSFEFLGACGGPARSLARVGETLFVGDVSGNLYRWQPGDPAVSYAFTGVGDAAALVAFQGDLVVAGSDAVARRYSTDGQLLASHPLPAPITSGLVIGSELYLGTEFGLVVTLDLADGSTGFAGTCGGPVGDLLLDPGAGSQGELVLSSTDGSIYRIDLATQVLTSSFPAPNDGTSLVLHMGDLLVGGSDGSLHRIDAHDGQVLETLVGPGALDLQALLLPVGLEPGVSYCYGLGCPCGNDDLAAGCVNGTGRGSLLRSSGSRSVAADDLFMTVSDMPGGQFGRFYMGAGLNHAPFGNGILCAGSGGYGQFRFELFHSGSAGFATLGLGIVAHSQESFGALGQIFPGQTWHFQVWHRDPQGPCGASFNTSNGVSVTFEP